MQTRSLKESFMDVARPVSVNSISLSYGYEFDILRQTMSCCHWKAGSPPLRSLAGLSTPLHVAVKYPQEDSAVGVLIRGGADPTARNVNGETPLHQVKTAADAVLADGSRG